MIIGVPKEIKLQEHRIGLTPESVKTLTGKGHEVLIQHNGGFEAGFSDKEINLIHGPIGIKLGGRSAPEIALSIIAQLVAETYKK